MVKCSEQENDIKDQGREKVLVLKVTAWPLAVVGRKWAAGHSKAATQKAAWTS
jgi:hypothetical protein